MSSSIDLLIRQDANGNNDLQVFLSAPGRQDAFVVPIPSQLLTLQQVWRQRFLKHHDPAFAWDDGAAVVRSYSEQLRQGLQQWIDNASWNPLQRLLAELPALPLTVRLEGVDPALSALPWESLALQRPVWRLDGDGPAVAASFPVRARKPRILLLVGSEKGLNLDGEVERLQDQQRSGRIRLTVLRGGSFTPAALRAALAQSAGWDAVLYLGHTSAGPNGGLLHLGDGSQLDGQTLEADLAAAASHGLRLLLFNSCSGLQLAERAVRVGIDWAVCFLEPVPSAAAALAFSQLLEQLETGSDLQAAIAQTRHVLAERDGCEGCELLLAAVATPTAASFQLPLRRRRQLVLRLASSTRKQAIAAAAFVGVAFLMELTPYNIFNTYLLDRRLDLQRTWRQLTAQPGPLPGRGASPIPVLLLNRSTITELGSDPGLDHTPRSALVELLRRTLVAQVPVVGIDVILDDRWTQMRLGLQQPEGHYVVDAVIRLKQEQQDLAMRDLETAALASVISSQPARRVVGGFVGAESSIDIDGDSVDWVKVSPLTQAGLEPFDLAVGTVAGNDGLLKPVPLHLIYAITADNFSGALSRVENPFIPADRIIDWSTDWARWIRIVQPEELADLRAPVLLVGTGGYLNQKPADLFSAPATVQNALMRGEQPIWGGKTREIPGVLVQAVLIQSLNLRHWLTPLSQTLCTATAASLGVVLAALLEKRQHRLIALGLIVVSACPLAWSLAIGPLLLVPLLLPLLALSSTTLCRDD